jgi:alpha-tubulin suppressor-like RCC1 family protein
MLPVTNIAAIATTSTTSLFLDNQGYVWTTHQNLTAPTRIPELQDITAISGHTDHFLLLDTSGTAWSSGGNTFGQRGLICKSSDQPLQIESLPPIVAILAQQYKSFFVEAVTQRVWACGSNLCRELANDGEDRIYDPVIVEDILISPQHQKTNFVKVKASRS